MSGEVVPPIPLTNYWYGYGYDHVPGCPAVPRCTCGYVEVMRAFFAEAVGRWVR